jgi:hypothetical protein
MERWVSSRDSRMERRREGVARVREGRWSGR